MRGRVVERERVAESEREQIRSPSSQRWRCPELWTLTELTVSARRLGRGNHWRHQRDVIEERRSNSVDSSGN